MGHEASGIVHSVGSAVTQIKPGDRIAIEPGFPCRRCRHCKDGTYNLCPEMRFAACPPDAHGTLTKYFKIPEDFCYKLSSTLELQEAALAEPLAVAVHTARLAGVKPGQTVVVFGSGTIGLLCAAVSKAFGAKRVVAVDIMEEKLQFAKGYIPDCGLFRPSLELSSQENAETMIRDLGLNDGVDAVLEASGAEASVQTGIHVLRLNGALVLVGLGKPGLSSFPIMAMSQKEVTIRGCFRYVAGDYKTALDLLETGRISAKELITAVLPFERATEAWEMTRKGIGMKNLIRGVED
jgi:D-xylulose reductase